MPKRPDPDPDRDLHLDASRLRGIAHPLRVRLLSLLRADGPSTATRLAERVDESSAATSYHLRQLASYGFIVETDPPEHARRTGPGRERWWRAAYRSTYFDTGELVAGGAGEAGGVSEGSVLAGEYLRSVAALYTTNMGEWLARRDDMPAEWQATGTLSDIRLRLTPAEAEELVDRVHELLRSYRSDDPDQPAPEGTERVVVQWQVLPVLRGEGEGR